MRRFRVSIAGLMAAVLFVGVGVAALREASEIWSGVLFVLTVAAMAFAGLRAAYRQGGKRAFWAGFAVFGTTYLVLVFAPGTDSRPALGTQNLLTWLHPKIAREQPTTANVTFTNQVLTTNVYGGGWAGAPPGATTTVTTMAGPPVIAPPGAGQALAGFDADGVLDVAANSVQQLAVTPPPARLWFVLTTVDPTTFIRVGHCLFALLIAMLGGGIARWQWAAGTREEPPCPDAAS